MNTNNKPINGNAAQSAPIPLSRPVADRFVGIDIGAETIKVVELVREGQALHCRRRILVEHGKDPGPVLLNALKDWDWASVQSAAVSGRLSRQVNLSRVPAKQAQARGYRFLHNQQPGTVVSIGSHGFSVLEMRPNGMEIFRENSRCSQGTGNFLRQLVERFSLSIEEASALCAGVEKSAPLSGRCPVILKTDMTHLANKGEDRAAILAGLFDAVCENVLVLIKPGTSPEQVTLIGGVSRSPRVQNNFRQYLARHNMSLRPFDEEESLFLEAIGSAAVASRHPEGVPPLDQLLSHPPGNKMHRLPSMAASLDKVRRMAGKPMAPVNGEPRDLILGFDIGSTGSKVVAMDAGTEEVVWEGYLRTGGDPVGAAQALLRQYQEGRAGHCRIQSLGVTGSGREIVGSLMTTCYGANSVFVLNEIAAHAEGALHYDPRVDTIFEIGGQDAKYIRLADQRVIDCAMNEACSAGTGSFIEEQGRKFAGIRDVVQLGEAALAAEDGVSLGQHCSVFMAEIIDEAVAVGVDQRSIIAGLYDSIIQNYLHRVKGNRSVGQVIFCQGMPFASDALAAAVARQTGSQVIIPPNPGTVGALGIALLTRRDMPQSKGRALDPGVFLGARIEKKDTFICKSTAGCGGAGNHCRIDSLKTVVDEKPQRFNWGGGCALYDRGTRKKKLPDLSPDPFREREGLVQDLIMSCSTGKGLGRIAISDEFMLKGMFPFFATFLHALGFDLVIPAEAGQATLKRGIQEANVPFCAPMQLFHGLVSQMGDEKPDYFFLPMIRGLPRMDGECRSAVCPIAQASADIFHWDLKLAEKGRVLSPVIDIGAGNMESAEFLASCQRLAGDLGIPGNQWREAWQSAHQAQLRFDEKCLKIGRRALSFCAERGLTPVVVVGRPYTIYNVVLNSNVPTILREQGAIGIPIDCYPIDDATPIFHDMYWGHGQRILRAAHQIRQAPGIYSLYCSNYSCGPDSFNLHFYSYIMEGKPFAIIETDGHSGDAGTKTRVEAFLHCVALDRESGKIKKDPNDFHRMELPKETLAALRQRGERVLVPWLGPGSHTLAASLRSIGIPAEALPQPDGEILATGRRHTSGKECLPMCLTLGNLLRRLEKEKDQQQRFTLLMPNTCGPCRFGVYNLLNRITLDRLDWYDRIRIWSPAETGYFADTPPGWAMLVFAGFIASDLLQQALLDVRPVETRPGAAAEIYQRYWDELLLLLERQGPVVLSSPASLWQVASGQFFGITSLLSRAADEFAGVRGSGNLPTVLLVGEIYVRCDPFANDFIIDKLEARGLRVLLAPFNEWLEYCDELNRHCGKSRGLSDHLSSLVQTRIRNQCHAIFSNRLGWPPPATARESLAAASPYLRKDLHGEAVLTVGTPIHEFKEGSIDATLSVGPLECMPNKIAEAQLFHVAEQERLPNLTLSLNGDSVDPEVMDNFAFEVHARYQMKHGSSTVSKPQSEKHRRGTVVQTR